MRALLLAGFIGLVFSLVVTPLFIRVFRWLGWGQPIRADGPVSHHIKRGTPSMGGAVIIVGSIIAYFVAKAVNGETPTHSAMLVIFMFTGLGLVGFVDDLVKARSQHSAGISGWQKILGQTAVSVAFALMSIQLPDSSGMTPASTHLSTVRDTGFDFATVFNFFTPSVASFLGTALFVLWICLLVASASNGVNVTDGLDGLATGASIMSIGAFAVIGFWKFNQACDPEMLTANCYTTRDPLDLAVIAAALVGSLIGFLWYNTSPAKIFMGDTGSLALGGALASLAILSRTELLLVMVGGLFVIEAGSVILQRGVFKVTKWRTGQGRRIIRMSPLHHHFEQVTPPWHEITIVVRFWVICGLCVLGAIGLFYVEWYAAR